MQKTILIVDDTKEHAEELSKIIVAHKYNVMVARDGAEALEVIEKTKPDLIVLDLNLPKVSGETVCLKTKKAYPEIIIIVLSAKKKSTDVVHGLEIGADDYLTKPVMPNVLLARIKKQLKTAQEKDPSTQEMIRGELSKLTFRESTALLAARIVSTELFFGLLYFLVSIGVSLLEPYFGTGALFPEYLLASLILLITNIVLAISLLLRWHFHFTEVNRDGISKHSGILHKKVQKYVCKFVEIVTVEQTLLGQLLNFGTLELYDPALKEQVTLLNIANPKKNGRLIEMLISKEQDQPIPFLAGH